MQLINLAAGGSLYQDIAEQKRDAIKHDYFPFGGQTFSRDYLAHDVTVSSGTRLAKVFGAGPLRVNSMHHQGIRELGAGLTPSAVAGDGLIEALEGRRDAYLVGVQWHPEALTDTQSAARDLFDDFVKATLVRR
jgi:putative glutamine amidotransferase